MNLRPPSVTASTQTSAFDAIVKGWYKFMGGNTGEIQIGSERTIVYKYRAAIASLPKENAPNPFPTILSDEHLWEILLRKEALRA